MNLRFITKEPFELPGETVDLLEASATIRYFKKNETIIEPGCADAPWYFITAGLARIFTPARDSDETDTTILFGEAGNIATSPSNFILGLPAVTGVQAVTPTKAYSIPASVIRDLYGSDPVFARWLLELALIQIAHLEIRSTYFRDTDPYKRFLSFIRFKPKSYMRRVPGYMLASYLSLSLSDFFKAKERYERESLDVGYDKEFLDKVGLTGTAPEE